ncbi:MAG: GNAT family N-acetyltransferase [Promethearchaeota archaeon]
MDEINFDVIKEKIWDEFPVLESSRLRMREILITDKQKLFEIWGNPLVNQYTDFPGLDDPECVSKFIEMAQERFTSKNGIRWALTLKDEGLLIGTMGYNRWITRFGNFAVMGYDLDPDYWRKGYSYEAGQIVVDYGFNIMKLHRIEADIDPLNIASEKLLKKLGFQLEGVHREKFYWVGQFQTSAMYSRLSTDI